MLSHAAANLGPRPVTDLSLISDHQMLDFQRLIHSYSHTLVRPQTSLPLVPAASSSVVNQMEFLPGFAKTYDRS